MDRKDWLLVLLAATLGVLGTLGGSLVAGYQYERAAARQAQLDLAKQQEFHQGFLRMHSVFGFIPNY